MACLLYTSTENRDGHAIQFVRVGQPLDGIRDVEGKLVIATFVRPDEHGSHPKRGGLTGALEVKDGSSIDKGIAQGKARAVPTLAAKIGLVRVAGIVGVEAVGQNGGLP